MLYNLFEFLENQYQLPGAGLFQYLSFRASVSVILSLGISIIYGKKIIKYLMLILNRPVNLMYLLLE